MIILLHKQTSSAYISEWESKKYKGKRLKTVRIRSCTYIVKINSWIFDKNLQNFGKNYVWNIFYRTISYNHVYNLRTLKKKERVMCDNMIKTTLKQAKDCKLSC